VPNLSEPDERYIRDYVNSQSPKDDQTQLVQKVGSRRILGSRRDLFDVHCAHSRWWVITDPTNLYSQDDFPQVEQALIFHIGLGVFMTEHSRSELEDAEAQEQVASSWRRLHQAIDSMNDAEESEAFQAVGVKCRDALIALAKDHASSDWLGEVSQPPKAADFKGWSNLFADRLSEGRMRSYLKALVDKTWDLTVWLQHNSNATPLDADIVLEATGHLIETLGRLIRRQQIGDPLRCPRCDSYRVNEDVQDDDAKEGVWTSDVCTSCGWRTEPVFTSWAEHFEGTDLLGYLSSPGTGISDRLHPKPAPNARA
jgi:hypothetical protein